MRAADLPRSISHTTAAYLSSDIADLRFAKSFEVSALSLASMLYDATAEFTGFRDALQRGVGSAVSAPLTAGLKSLDRLLERRSERAPAAVARFGERESRRCDRQHAGWFAAPRSRRRQRPT